VFIDIDRFKIVNDSRGHGLGNQLRKAVAAAMRDHVRISDKAGRLGGDEFGLLLLGMKSASAEACVEQLQGRQLHAMKLNDWPVTFSLGVASHRVTPDNFDGLLKRATR